MANARVVTEVSSTVRQPGISVARVRYLVDATLKKEKIRNAMISVAFIGRAAIEKLNRQYLRRTGATDVISFGMGRDAPGMPAIGDIYICPDVARRNARRLGISVRDEIARLVVHGVLHVAGHDHPEGESRTRSKMWLRQESILADLD